MYTGIAHTTVYNKHCSTQHIAVYNKYTELSTTHTIVHTHTLHYMYTTHPHTLHYMYCTLHTDTGTDNTLHYPHITPHTHYTHTHTHTHTHTYTHYSTHTVNTARPNLTYC